MQRFFLKPHASAPASPVWSTTAHNSNVMILGAGLVASGTSVPNAGWLGAGDATTTAIGAGVKRYFEITCVFNSVDFAQVGVGNGTTDYTATGFLGQDANSVGFTANGHIFFNGADQGAFAAAINSGDIIGVAVDTSGDTIEFNANGGAFTTPFSISSMTGTLFPAYRLNSVTSGNQSVTATFRAPFSGTPPAGYTGYP